jgi:hypothetical protein
VAHRRGAAHVLFRKVLWEIALGAVIILAALGITEPQGIEPPGGSSYLARILFTFAPANVVVAKTTGLATTRGRLLFLGKRCCESRLPFTFKWQPNIATTQKPTSPMACALPYSTLPSPLCNPSRAADLFPLFCSWLLILSSRIKPLLEMRLEALEHLFFYVFDVGEPVPTSDIAVFTVTLKLQNEFFH